MIIGLFWLYIHGCMYSILLYSVGMIVFVCFSVLVLLVLLGVMARCLHKGLHDSRMDR